MSPPGLLRYSCCAKGCKNAYYSPITESGYQNIRLFQFPVQNVERRAKWLSIMNLQDTGKRSYLCTNHFDGNQFCDSLHTRLSKFAVPRNNDSKHEKKIVIISDITVKQATSPQDTNSEVNSLSPPCTSANVKDVISEENLTAAKNSRKRICDNDFTEFIFPKLPRTSPCAYETDEYSSPINNSFRKRKFDSVSSVSSPCKKRRGTLSCINEARVRNLSPRKRKFYNIIRAQKQITCKLKSALRKRGDKLRTVCKLSNSKFFKDIEGKLHPVGVSFLKSTFNNVNVKRHKWSVQDKVYALALFKKGPRCYNFLKHFIPLPSRSTLQKLLRNVPFDAGLNPHLLQKLTKMVARLKPLDRTCILMFDEIGLSKQLVFDRMRDKIIGYVDLGPLGRKNELANEALVFMIHGLHKSWKQPIAYFFTKDTVKTNDLKFLIKDIISSLQKAGLRVLATVCDQGPTNRAAINQLTKEKAVLDKPGPYFIVNGDKIFTLFDPPHLLKSTRNAFLKYNVLFSNTKIAKFEHIKQCFHIDRMKRFQALRKIRETYLYLENKNYLKMKVCIAARTLSNTVAAALESMISCNLQCSLPTEAMHTAEFIHDIDCLFDSLNGKTPKPDVGKPYRRCMSLKSPHTVLWNQLLSKIRSWVFISKDGSMKEQMPFKSGWLTTIEATKGLFEVCSEMGFQFLRTRSLNQDPLENTFAAIRNCGASNTNPNCFQFLSAFKTSVLNNLIVPSSKGRNCENDDGRILDNLQSFLDVDSTIIPLSDLEVNELESIEIPVSISTLTDTYDDQTLTYVCGFLTKKLKSLNCEECAINLISDSEDHHHILTAFKENDDKKKRLTYVTIKIVEILRHIHDIIIFLLPKFGHVSNLINKMKLVLKKQVSFQWYSCTEHLDTVENDFLNYATSLVIKKYYDDLYRTHQVISKSKINKKKLEKLQHC